MARAETHDLGLFGPGSITWKVHSEPCTLVGGLRALLIQALHPVAMAAVSQHSDFRDDPWGRFRRTSDYLATTVFGDSEQAGAAAARVRSVHRRISGVDPVTGRRYRADDPDLLLWVHCVEVHSFMTAYRRYGGRLVGDEPDRYVAEMVRSAELIGLHAEDVPGDVASLRSYLRSMDPVLCLSPAAKESIRYVLAPPLPLPVRPLWAFVSTAAVALLPRKVRALYNLTWIPAADPPLRLSTFTLFRAVRMLLPPPPAIRAAYDRARAAA